MSTFTVIPVDGEESECLGVFRVELFDLTDEMELDLGLGLDP